MNESLRFTPFLGATVGLWLSLEAARIRDSPEDSGRAEVKRVIHIDERVIQRLPPGLRTWKRTCRGNWPTFFTTTAEAPPASGRVVGAAWLGGVQPATEERKPSKLKSATRTLNFVSTPGGYSRSQGTYRAFLTHEQRGGVQRRSGGSA